MAKWQGGKRVEWESKQAFLTHSVTQIYPIAL